MFADDSDAGYVLLYGLPISQPAKPINNAAHASKDKARCKFIDVTPGP